MTSIKRLLKLILYLQFYFILLFYRVILMIQLVSIISRPIVSVKTEPEGGTNEWRNVISNYIVLNKLSVIGHQRRFIYPDFIFLLIDQAKL